MLPGHRSKAEPHAISFPIFPGFEFHANTTMVNGRNQGQIDFVSYRGLPSSCFLDAGADQSMPNNALVASDI
jgi:hypothetical protein